MGCRILMFFKLYRSDVAQRGVQAPVGVNRQRNPDGPVGACVDNLLHAACIETSALGPRRMVQMPALHLTMAEVVQAIARAHGPECLKRVRYDPQPAVQRLFASYPPLRTPMAEALGFRHDGSADSLTQRATAP